MAVSAPIFPAQLYEVQFVQQLIQRIYKEGKIPTRDENLFLLGLKSHTASVEISTKLLQEGNELYLHQFAANLLTHVSATHVYTIDCLIA